MRAAGAARIVAVVKEDIDNEVEEFKKGFWSEDVYVDKDKALYKALGEGYIRQPNGMCGFMMKALCPCGGDRLKENMAAAKDVKQNYNGEGFITGGFYILKADGSVAFSAFEDEYGDRADVDKAIEAIKASV